MAKDILTRLVMLKGESGSVIESIEILSSSGATDIMRITLSDGSTVDFPVTNTLDDDHIKQVLLANCDTELSYNSENPVQNKVITEYIGNIENQIEWQFVDSSGSPVSGWTSLDANISSYENYAKEFLAEIKFKGSDETDFTHEIIIPNKALDAGKTYRDFISGYYNGANYNASFQVRFNPTSHKIQLMRSWTQVTGNFSDPSTEPILDFRVYYRPVHYFN